MRIYCWTCGKSVSSELPGDSVLRAVAVCPECIEARRIVFAEDIDNPLSNDRAIQREADEWQKQREADK